MVAGGHRSGATSRRSSTIRLRQWGPDCATPPSWPASTWSSRRCSRRWRATPSRGSRSGARLCFFIILSTLMVPSAVTFIPSYVVVNGLGGVGHALGHCRSGSVQRLRHLPFPPVLPGLPGRDRGGRPARWARLLRHLSGVDPAEFARDHDGARHPQLHLLPGTPSSGRWSSSGDPGRLDRPGGAVDLPDRPDDQPARALHGRGSWRRARWSSIFLFMQRYIVQGVKLSGIKG